MPSMRRGQYGPLQGNSGRRQQWEARRDPQAENAMPRHVSRGIQELGANPP